MSWRWAYWDDIIRDLYNGHFHVNQSFPGHFPADSRRPYYNLRYDYDYISCSFRFVGYLALVELALSSLDGFVVLSEFSAIKESSEEKKDENGSSSHESGDDDLSERLSIPGNDTIDGTHAHSSMHERQEQGRDQEHEQALEEDQEQEHEQAPNQEEEQEQEQDQEQEQEQEQHEQRQHQQ